MFEFVRINDAQTSNMGAIFSNGNDAADLIVLSIVAYAAATGVTWNPPSTFTDSAGNTFTLIGQSQSSVYTGTGYYAFYFVAQCKYSQSTTIEMPSTISGFVNVPNNEIIMYATEYRNSVSATINDGGVTFGPGPDNPTITDMPTTTGDLVVTAGLCVAGTIIFQSIVNQRTSPNGTVVGDFTAGGSSETFNAIYNVGDGSFIAAVALKYSTAGPSAGGGSITGLITGPKYTFQCLPEGRKLGRIAINLPSFAVTPGAFNFPELSDQITLPSNVVGFISLEFDLQFLFQGTFGLSQVRSLMAYSKPLFVGDDFVASAGAALPAIITNLNTNQSIILGAAAIALNKAAAVEYLASAFACDCATSGKVRFLSPQLSFNPIGRFNLLFCNWDEPQGITVAGSF